MENAINEFNFSFIFSVMSSMEEDASRFLKKIVKTISAAIVWMLFIMTFGIYNGWLFFGEAPTLGNYIFYALALASLVALLLYFAKVWKDEFKNKQH